jgi:heat-inducible transcriptional repressor
MKDDVTLTNTDETSLPELTRRQEEILSLIVRAYTHSPEPISSKYLVDTYHLGISAATVRNEMAVLEDLGYIHAPHTSAGRVPTETGYRYFVRRLINASDLTTAEQSRIAEKLQSLPLATEQWMRVAASILARTSQSAALVTAPIAESSKFKHLELISIQGRLVLMVLVLHGGAVHQQMLTLADAVTQPALTDAAARINAVCTDLGANEVRLKSVQMPLLEREVLELVADLLEKSDTNQVRLVYRDGLSDVITTFQNNEGAQQMVRVFEERAFLNVILGEMMTPTMNTPQVVIAGNGRWEELSHLSLVLSRYGIQGQAAGTLGVLGPTHINYGRAISIVRYVSGLMTDMMTTLYDAGSNTKSLGSGGAGE